MVTLPEVFPNISETTNNSPPQDHPHREQGVKLCLIQAPMRLNFSLWRPNPKTWFIITLPRDRVNEEPSGYQEKKLISRPGESIKRKASTNLYKAESNVFGSHVFMFRGIESWWRYSCNSLWWISNKSRFKVLITYWELSKNICWYMLPN